MLSLGRRPVPTELIWFVVFHGATIPACSWVSGSAPGFPEERPFMVAGEFVCALVGLTSVVNGTRHRARRTEGAAFIAGGYFERLNCTA